MSGTPSRLGAGTRLDGVRLLVVGTVGGGEAVSEARSPDVWGPMAEQAVFKEVVISLRLEPDIELEAAERACAVAELMKMSPDKVDEVKMAVIEACINAIEHSHAQDRMVQLHILVLGRDEPEALQITVQDHGVGFDPQKLVQPIIDEKLKSSNKRGWGLKIIEGLMDNVQVESSESGTTVTMRKAL